MTDVQLISILFDRPSLKAIIKKLHDDTTNFLNSAKLNELFMHLLLVLEGYRDGYLIDGCSVTLDNVQSLLASLADSFNLVGMRLRSPLVSIALGPNLDDFVVISSGQLQRKLSNLFSPSWIDTPIIVDVSTATPYICDVDEIQSMKHALQETFRCMLNSTDLSFSVVADALFNEVVGFPFVAGWLLGYPFIYRSVHPSIWQGQASSTPPPIVNVLSMIRLRKISVRANISESMFLVLSNKSKSVAKIRDNCIAKFRSQYGTIDLFEFSVPMELIDEASGTLLHLNSWLKEKEMRHDKNTSSLGTDVSFKLVEYCYTQLEDITSPSLIL